MIRERINGPCALMKFGDEVAGESSVVKCRACLLRFPERGVERRHIHFVAEMIFMAMRRILPRRRLMLLHITEWRPTTGKTEGRRLGWIAAVFMPLLT